MLEAHGIREPGKRLFLDVRLQDDVPGEELFSRRGEQVLLRRPVAPAEFAAADLLEEIDDGALGEPLEIILRGRTPPGGNIDLELAERKSAVSGKCVCVRVDLGGR